MKKKAVLIAALLSATLGGTLASAQTLPQATREKIIKATVMLLPTGADGKLSGSLGSGSIISPSGYILTNYHVIGDVESRQISPWIQVRTIRFADQEPVPSYWGNVVAADPNLDLAIVKITEDKDQKPVSNLNLPFVQLGDSNSLTIGDPIYVFGFQGTGGMTMSYSQGSVSGFTGDDLQSSGRQWIKHDAQTGPGNSGGGIYDARGDLIGIHSAGVSGDHNSRTSFMRPIALAWGLITPNVPKFAVRPGTGIQASAPPASQSSSSASGGKVASKDSAPVGSITSWPPKIAVGQAWGVITVGNDIDETWQLKLTALSTKGNPKGTASSKNKTADAFLYYSKEEDTVWYDMAYDKTAFISCKFQKGGIKNGMLTGALLYFKDGQADGQEIGDCGAMPMAATGTGVATAPPANTSSTASSKLTWPLRPQKGQNWTFQIPTFGQVKVSLTGTDNLGPIGKGTLPKGTTIDAAFYYDEKDKTTWLDLFDKSSLLYCAFDAKSIGNGTLKGTAYFRKDKDSGQDAENLGECTGKLN